MEPIIPIQRIQREARAAAKQYSDVNDACPYPFGTAAGRLFREEFAAARATSKASEEVKA